MLTVGVVIFIFTCLAFGVDSFLKHFVDPMRAPEDSA